MTNAKVILSS